MNEELIIVRKILKLGNRLINTRSQNLEAHGLTAEQSETLQFFDLHKGACASELKEYLGISHQAARNIIERMKKKDLLYNMISSKDARIKPVFLTKNGETVCDTLKKEGSNVGLTILNGFSREEKDTFKLLLDKISGNLKQNNP